MQATSAWLQNSNLDDVSCNSVQQRLMFTSNDSMCNVYDGR